MHPNGLALESCIPETVKADDSAGADPRPTAAALAC